MELPPRVKTQFPNRGNIVNDERVPIPIETSFFLEDAEKDTTRMNRYYFNFPAEWATSNKGESIIGVRSMWLLSRRRRLEYTVEIYKVEKQMLKTLGGDIENDIFDLNDYNNKLITFFTLCSYERFKVVDWVSTESDFRRFFEALNEAFQYRIKKNEGTIKFTQEDDDVVNRDIQTDGYYDKDGFREVIFSYKNKNNKLKENSTEYEEPYMCFYRISDYNDDFKEVFNIGTEPFQNNPDYYKVFRKEVVFNNIWDRHSCKVYSSIGEQSLHHYIGNSQVAFNPIKYFKLNSTDQRFWIELYSGRNYNVPINLPKNESFVIEMQFLSFDKMLYV